jgi:transglutaminase-like putative cysteine protease
MSNLYEDSSDPEIIKTAKKVAGNAVGRDEKIDRVAKFVSRYISNKNYDHSNLSASEVLRKKSGDCTEHSTLFAALMRALGVPVKMVYGLVMTPDGEFFFHNWNEALGDTGWVPVDSTFRLVPADAARITIIYGGADSGSREQVSLSVFRFLTGVKIRVKSFSEGGLRR